MDDVSTHALVGTHRILLVEHGWLWIIHFHCAVRFTRNKLDLNFLSSVWLCSCNVNCMYTCKVVIKLIFAVPWRKKCLRAIPQFVAQFAFYNMTVCKEPCFVCVPPQRHYSLLSLPRIWRRWRSGVGESSPLIFLLYLDSQDFLSSHFNRQIYTHQQTAPELDLFTLINIDEFIVDGIKHTKRENLTKSVWFLCNQW